MPPDNLRLPYSHIVEHFELCNFDPELIGFELKVLERSGIGVEACVPESVHELPPDDSMKRAQAEGESFLFRIVKDLLLKHKVYPRALTSLCQTVAYSVLHHPLHQ